MDKNKIPKGPYCYTGKLGKHRCPYFIYRNIFKDVILPYCLYLNKGCITDCKEDEIQKLSYFHRCRIGELFELYPLDLLWDQVKECGINEE